MNQTPLVSICCITYNHVNYIRDAIEGFLMQETSFPFEIIIHDDASTDGTSEIIQEYANKYPELFVTILQKENQWSKGGGSIYVRFVYPRAKGKYIALCEGDDYWTDPLKLQKQVDFLEANTNCDICFTYSLKVDQFGKKLEEIQNLKLINYSQHDILTGKKYQTRTSTIVIRRYLIEVENFYHYSVFNGDTWVKIFGTKQNMGVVLPFIASCYRIHSGGIWSSETKKNKHMKSYNDWKQKLKYSLENNKQASITILYKLTSSFLKWNYYKIFQR